jgi:D-methionine transport system substrate-binding protein
MKKFVIATVLLVYILVCPLSATAQETEPRKLRVGCVETSLGILEKLVPYVESKGYEVEPVIFDNNVNVIRATNDGGVDASLGVHKPFMEKFNADNKGDLVMLEPYAYYAGMGLFSSKYKKKEEIPQGAKIAIMNDSMNMDRALKILRDAGFITLKEQASVYTTLDIEGNPSKIDLIDMDQIQTVRALSELDAAVVFFTHMLNAGLDCRDYLFSDQNSNLYPMAIVVKRGFSETSWAKELEEGLRSQAVREFMSEKYPGVYEFYE